MCLSPPVCFEKPQTLQGKHKKEEEGRGVTRRGTDDQLRPMPQPDFAVQKTMSEQQAAANSRPVTTSDVRGRPEVSAAVKWGTRDDIAEPPQGLAGTLGVGGLYYHTNTRSSM